MLRRVLIGSTLLLAAFIVSSKLVEWWTEAWWFQETGYLSVYQKILWTRWIIFVAGAGLFAGIIGVNAYYAWRVVARQLASPPDIIAQVTAIPEPGQTQYFERYHRYFWIFGIVVPSLLAGQSATSRWMLWHHLVNSASPGLKARLAPSEIDFYLLQLPALNFSWSFVFIATLLALALVLLVYALEGMINFAPTENGGRPLPSAVVRHLALLIALLLVWKCVGYLLSPYNLHLQQNGITYGVGYTDVHWRTPILSVLGALALGSAAATVWLSRRRYHGRWPNSFLWPVQLYLIAAVFVGTVLPWLVQRFVVEPDELEREQRYITRHIDHTLRAYGLDRVRRWPGVSPGNDLATVAQRLPSWPPSVLTQELNRRSNSSDGGQYFRASYDSYFIGGEERTVLVAPRDLAVENLPVPDWRNTRLLHNFGSGLEICDATKRDSTGSPVFYLTSRRENRSGGDALSLQRPELIFAEFPRSQPRASFIPPTRSISSPPGIAARPPNQSPALELSPTGAPRRAADRVQLPSVPPPPFVVLNSQHASHEYVGSGGVPLGAKWRKWLLAWRFFDLNLALSSEVSSRGRVVWHRRVVDRCRQLAPYLSFEAAEPRPVVTNNGRIVWLVDGFTVSSHYPDAAPVDANSPVNYVRHAVTATIDAYDGTVQFFIIDTTDPIMASNRAAFPQLFRPLTSMEPDLRAHLRYPTQYLSTQARIWGMYAHKDADDWLRRENITFPTRFDVPERDGSRRRIDRLATILPIAKKTMRPNGRGALASVAVLAPSNTQGPLSAAGATQRLQIASMLLGVVGEPLFEWRPRAPLALPDPTQPPTSDEAQKSPASFALIPSLNRLLLLVGKVKATQESEASIETRWSVIDAERTLEFGDLRQALGRMGASIAPDSGGDPAGIGDVRKSSTTLTSIGSLFGIMQQARRDGNWKQYEQAEDKIEKLLERYTE